jgi:peptide/nickel transport system permease protein
MAILFLRRMLEMIPLLLGISMITFFVIQLSPGKPTDVFQGAMQAKVDPRVYERLREIYGLNDPLPVQFFNWLKRIVRLDFGLSMSTDRRPVIEKIANALPVTLFLNLLSLLLTLSLALPLAIYRALNPRSSWTASSSVVLLLGFSTPSFWLALLLMILFGIHLRWLPLSWAGMPRLGEVPLFDYFIELFRHSLLPVFCMSFGSLALFTRYLEGSLKDVLGEEYILTARAKGGGTLYVLLRHALPNALLPLVTLLGLSLPNLVSGSVIIETIFGIPGMGLLFIQGVYIRDYTLIMGILTLGAILTLVGNLLADIGYALLDPRVRLSLTGRGS